jgi:hypothetical protein
LTSAKNFRRKGLPVAIRERFVMYLSKVAC